uniref:Serpin domain-containing protein n=1 Tax=Terrapene triunguis TaxID=2587831 RepID=A0A674IU90_9SAUR
MNSISEATTKFALDFFKVLNKDHPSDNIIYSPLSISAALGMVLLGARGNTATQIEKVATLCYLKVPDNQCDIPGGIHSQFHDIISAINKPTASYELAIANRLYGEKTFNFLQTTSIPVQMMYHKGEYKIATIEEHNCQVLELPYKDGDLSMYILLPKDYTGLTQLEKELTYEKLTTWISPYYMKEDEVEVSLPQFKIETEAQLNQYLEALGITDVFNHESDLSGIAKAGGLSVSGAVHKAYIEVNEEGTEAAAATGIGIGVTSVRPQVEFVADHPFLFIIRHQKTESILFYGRFSSP